MARVFSGFSFLAFSLFSVSFAEPGETEFRTFDGSKNNVANSSWGSVNSQLLRKAAANYADGISTPNGSSRPGPRLISNTIVDQGDEDIISDRFLSAMAYAWGQFLDHDLDLTPNASPKQPFPISLPLDDPFFGGATIIPLNRSKYDLATGTSNPRQQVNVITAWIDGSQIYGSDDVIAKKLRTLSGGRLKTSSGNFLPFNNATTFPEGTLELANDSRLVPNDELYAAGDVRVNENVELTSLHTLFVREHNRLANRFQQSDSSLDDDTLYQVARARVIAELQVITYREWLPALLGSNAIRSYRGYNPDVNAGIANEFSTALFRVGHSMLGNDVEFLDNDGLPVAEEIPLSEAFFNPPVVQANGGIGPILKYLVTDPSSEIDSTIVGSVRNFLFGPPGAGGLDLASLNIQRGREHGLADYNTVRAAYGLSRVTRFSDISTNRDTQKKLESLYGTVDDIDLWVGGLAEDHAGGGSTGILIRRALQDQFERLRDGDRFWYQQTLTRNVRDNVENTTLADVIRRNTNISNLQDNVFFFRASISGYVYFDGQHDGRRNSRDTGLEGRTVTLINAEGGEEVGSVETDRDGFFRFTTLNGLGAGEFTLKVELPRNLARTTRPRTLAITKGDTFLRHDIGITRRR